MIDSVLPRRIFGPGFVARAFAILAFAFAAQVTYAASTLTKVTIHVPSKSLSIMPYYLGKDKGFFAAEQIEPQLVMMSPPTANRSCDNLKHTALFRFDSLG